MSGRSRHLYVLFLCISLAGAGCCSRCGSYCTPEGPWQSPTFQATRALLVVNTPELRILRVNGRNVRPSCIGRDGVREYHLPAGTHTVTATFRYAGLVAGGLLGEVRGAPLTIEQQFLAGHEYVPVYREFANGRTNAKYLVEAIGAAVAGTDRYWSLDVMDLANAPRTSYPEVAEAQDYCALIRGLAADIDVEETPSVY